MRRLRSVLPGTATAGLLLLLLVSLFWPMLLRHATFRSKPLAAEHRSPAVWGYTGEEVTFRTSDGVQLHGWFLPAPVEPEKRCGTALFLHGNAGNVARQVGFGAELMRHGLDVLVFDYRGYGASEGTPSEAGLYRDAEAAYDYLRDVHGIAPERAVLVGHSLGSAVAVQLAASRPAAALVLAAPFASFPDAIQTALPWFPIRLLRWPSERFDALVVVPHLSLPILMAAGSADRLIPAKSARALYRAAPEPKWWVDVNGGHNQVLKGPEFHAALTALLQQQLGCADSSSLPPA